MMITDDTDAPEPEDLHRWTARGFTVADARRWIDHGFLLPSAERWRASGVYTPDDALAWRTAGLTPYSVQPLLRAGMTPRDAVRWHEMGYSHSEAAERHVAGERLRPKRWWRRRPPSHSTGNGNVDGEHGNDLRTLLAAGVPPAVARSYLDTGWRGDEAVAWALAGINPAQAAVYHAMEFSPAEATTLTGPTDRTGQTGRTGQTDLSEQADDALGLMRRWWDAGVPRTEVAAWVMAGFTAADAGRARQQDTTLDQAEVLRALGGRPSSSAE